MATATYTFPDGRTATIQFESDEQYQEAIRALEGMGKTQDSSLYRTLFGPEGITGTIKDVPRQLGLTGRYALEAFGQKPVADYVGLPQPANATERVVGDISRTLVGAGGLAKGAAVAQQATQTVAPTVSRIAGTLADDVGAQAAGAIGAGAAGGVVKEEGGGPTAQFIASVAGGFAAPFASRALGNAGRAVKATAGRVRDSVLDSMGVPTTRIQQQIQISLERSGIDWQSLSREAQVQLIRDADDAVRMGRDLDPAAVRRLADFRNIGATPTTGQITMDPRLITEQENLARRQMAAGGAMVGRDLGSLKNQNAQRVIDTIDGIERSPMDGYVAGERLIGRVQSADAAMDAGEQALYRTARNEAGRDVPLDRRAFVDRAFDNLVDNNAEAFLPAEIRQILNQISVGQVTVNGQPRQVPFNVNVIDQLKTILATATRNTRDGNVRKAIASVRDALENTPVQSLDGNPMPPAAMRAFDAARTAARDRREWQGSAAFIEDALGGATPDNFVQKHILSSRNFNEVARIRDDIQADPELLGGIRAQIVNYIKNRGGLDADVTKFSSKGLEDGLRAIGNRKLELFFSPEEIQQLRSAINVAKYIQAQPIGSAVNNSNSATTVMGLLDRFLIRPSQAVPLLGPLMAGPITRASIGVQGRQALNAPSAIALPRAYNPMAPVNPLLAAAIAPSSEDD